MNAEVALELGNEQSLGEFEKLGGTSSSPVYCHTPLEAVLCQLTKRTT